MGRKPVDRKPCLIPSCKNTARGTSTIKPYYNPGSKGLCHSCYQKARLMVKAGGTTWEELESLGLAELKRKTVRNCNNLFLDALEEAREKVKGTLGSGD